jgi:preprotein translocase subunit SecE
VAKNQARFMRASASHSLGCFFDEGKAQMASSQIETVGSGAEKAKLALVGLLIVVSVIGFYFLSSQGTAMQWSALVVGLLLAAVVFAVSDSGKRFRAFLRDVATEVKKVVWPSRKETTQMTLVVCRVVFVRALFLWLTDVTLEGVFYHLILQWR